MHVDLNQGRLAVRQRPAGGDIVLFIHGLGADSSCFEKCFSIPVLDGFHLVAPDLVGFGDSDKPAELDYRMSSLTDQVEELLGRLAVQRVHVVGHSMGGTIAALLAQRLPNRIITLIVAEPNLVARDATLSRAISSEPETVFCDNFEEFLHRVRQDMGQSSSGRAYVDCLARCSPPALHRAACSLVETAEAPEFVQMFLELPMPKHYLLGEISQHTAPPPEQIVDAGVPVHLIAGAGHGMMIDNPIGFSQAIVRAITQPNA